MAGEVNKQRVLGFQCLQSLCILLSRGPVIPEVVNPSPATQQRASKAFNTQKPSREQFFSPVTCVHSSVFGFMFEAL